MRLETSLAASSTRRASIHTLHEGLSASLHLANVELTRAAEQPAGADPASTARSSEDDLAGRLISRPLGGTGRNLPERHGAQLRPRLSG